MVLHFIGLGLGDEKDVTVRGLETIRKCAVLYLEHYTSVLAVGKERLEELYGKKVVLADREACEDKADAILLEARSKDIGFLVVGSPFAATTHMDLMIRAQNMGIKTTVSHNASIMNAIAACGLQLYNFGASVSICLFEEKWRPMSFYRKVAENQRIGLHSMCLLDIKIKEISYKNLMKGVSEYEKPRFLTADAAARQMLEVEREKKGGILGADSPVMAVCRAGQKDQLIVSGSLGEFQHLDFGKPLHTLVLPGHLHVLEKEMFMLFHWSKIIPEQKSKIPGDLRRKAETLRFLADPAATRRTMTTMSTAGKVAAGQRPRNILDLVHLLTAGSQGGELEKLSTFQEHMLTAAREFFASNPLEGEGGSRSRDGDGDDEVEVSDYEGKRRGEPSSGTYQERLQAQKKRWIASSEKGGRNLEEEEEEEVDDDDDTDRRLKRRQRIECDDDDDDGGELDIGCCENNEVTFCSCRSVIIGDLVPVLVL
mmetsp:Transcript_19567/g.31867  ORF Transcript_19567/g.31867 Transcript_19567/m.31867 type:complete len:483 (-) Transcript_19567:186-1634(-)